MMYFLNYVNVFVTSFVEFSLTYISIHTLYEVIGNFQWKKKNLNSMFIFWYLAKKYWSLFFLMFLLNKIR